MLQWKNVKFSPPLLLNSLVIIVCLTLNLCCSKICKHIKSYILRLLYHCIILDLSDSRSTSAVTQTTWRCTSTLVFMTTLMDLLSCATQRLTVVGVKRSGKYTTPYRGAPMSRWGNVTEGSQEVFSSPKSQGAYSPTYPQWCSAMRGDLFGEVLRSLCQIFSSKNKNIFWKYLLYFRLCWSWLETCLKWSFLTDRKSSFPTVTAWMSSPTSKLPETSNWLPSRSAERHNCSYTYVCLSD